jgi:NAD(P)-dependent dehydrogenase (short-subunit alcohol dehydrogenase family)
MDIQTNMGTDIFIQTVNGLIVGILYGSLITTLHTFVLLFFSPVVYLLLQYLLNLNFMGTLYPIKAVISRMKGRGEGRIVIVASQAALLGIYGYTVYSSTKFALRGLAESLHMEV